MIGFKSLLLLVAISACLYTTVAGITAEEQAYLDSLPKEFKELLIKIATKTSKWSDSDRDINLSMLSETHKQDKEKALDLMHKLRAEFLEAKKNAPRARRTTFKP